MKLLLISILIFQISGSICWAALEGSLAANALFEIALQYYNRGRYADALHEFNKTLIIQPGHVKAKQYIQLIQEMRLPPVEEKMLLPVKVSREEMIQRALEECEAEIRVPEITTLPKREPLPMPDSMSWEIAAGNLADFLVEIGLQYYNRGRYAEALHEFNKALVIKPGHEQATQYIQSIQAINLPAQKSL
jgi:tetratricopeptide (TPR) repeat protein